MVQICYDMSMYTVCPNSRHRATTMTWYYTDNVAIDLMSQSCRWYEHFPLLHTNKINYHQFYLDLHTSLKYSISWNTTATLFHFISLIKPTRPGFTSLSMGYICTVSGNLVLSLIAGELEVVTYQFKSQNHFIIKKIMRLERRFSFYPLRWF